MDAMDATALHGEQGELHELPDLLKAAIPATPAEHEALYDERVWALRLRGKSYREIVRDLEACGQHTTKERVMRAVQRMLRETAPRRKEARERWLGQAIARLEMIQSAAWQQFDTSGDPAYLNTIRGCERDIAQLRGLYDPSADDGAHAGGILISISRRGDVAVRSATAREQEQGEERDRE